jgi:hypothetical protein
MIYMMLFLMVVSLIRNYQYQIIIIIRKVIVIIMRKLIKGMMTFDRPSLPMLWRMIMSILSKKKKNG